MTSAKYNIANELVLFTLSNSYLLNYQGQVVFFCAVEDRTKKHYTPHY